MRELEPAMSQWVWGGCWGTALVVPRGRTGFGQLGRAYPKCTQTSGVRTQIQSRMYDAITDEPLVQSCQTRVRWKALDELETMRSLLGSVGEVLASKAAGQGSALFPFVRIRNIQLGNSEQRTGDKRNGCRCRNGQAKSAGTTLSTTGIDSGRSARSIGQRQGNAVAKMA